MQDAEKLKYEVTEEKTRLDEMRKSAQTEQEKMKQDLETLEGQVKDIDGLYIMQEQLRTARKALQEECNDLECQKKDMKEANDKLQV